MKNLGIHARLLIAAFFMISAATFTLDMVGIRITGTFMHKRFRDRIAFLAKYLAENAEVGVLIGDKTGLRSFAHNLLGEEDVARVAIFDNDGKKLVDLSKSIQDQLSFVEAPVVLKKSHGENLLYSYRTTPLGDFKMETVENIGKVRIEYSTKGIENLMKELNQQFIMISLGLVLLSGMVFFFLSRSIVVEVTKLAVTVQQVGRGDLELRALPGKIPETRELASAFNMMLDSLNTSRQALERVNQEITRHKALAERGKFSLMVAHEVKNPLGIIKSSLDVLKKDLDIPEDNLMVAYMEDEIRRLNRMIEDFLLFARPSDPVFRMTDLNLLLNEIADRFEIQQTFTRNRIIRKIPEESCMAHADMDLLTRALSNIVKNACEASGDNGEVSIHACMQHHIWIAEIVDKGDGISEENISRLFDPFFTTRSKGTGLGLAFADQVIRAHGGVIIAENIPDGGAMFSVEIPVWKT